MDAATTSNINLSSHKIICMSVLINVMKVKSTLAKMMISVKKDPMT